MVYGDAGGRYVSSVVAWGEGDVFVAFDDVEYFVFEEGDRAVFGG